MFNFLGNHKIGIIGDANSGKTVFLTSLLWNLENGDLQIGGVTPTNINVMSSDEAPVEYPFDYEGNKRKLQLENEWPAKTTADFAIAKCNYKLPGKMCRRNLTFVDIPGERMADMAIWRYSSFSKWSEHVLKDWRGSQAFSEYMKSFVKLTEQPESSEEDLCWAFKCGLRTMMKNYVSQISPSSLFFANGKVPKEHEIEDDDWLKARAIWEGGNFFPLPSSWKQSHVEVYRECERRYNAYRKQVLKPLFAQLGSCDSFICCIDIFNILATGTGAFIRNREEIKNLVEKVVPGVVKEFFKKTIGRNPMRIAFVATKSDKVYDENLNCLEYLLKDLVKPFKQSSMEFGYFTCTAWNSTKKDNKGFAMGTTFGINSMKPWEEFLGNKAFGVGTRQIGKVICQMDFGVLIQLFPSEKKAPVVAGLATNLSDDAKKLAAGQEVEVTIQSINGKNHSIDLCIGNQMSSEEVKLADKQQEQVDKAIRKLCRYQSRLETKDSLPRQFATNWNPKDYELLEIPLVPLACTAKPPQQTNLQEILEFVTEGGK